MSRRPYGLFGLALKCEVRLLRFAYLHHLLLIIFAAGEFDYHGCNKNVPLFGAEGALDAV